jgi:hypothetical protein
MKKKKGTNGKNGGKPKSGCGPKYGYGRLPYVPPGAGSFAAAPAAQPAW